MDWKSLKVVTFVDIPLGNLTTRFHIPLEKAGVDVMLLKEEFVDMLDYAKRYLPLSQDGYRTTWWKLFNAPDSDKWANILPTYVEWKSRTCIFKS